MSGSQRLRNSAAVPAEQDKQQVLGKDALLTSLVFNSLDNSYPSIAVYNGMRNVSRDFRTTVDMDMRPVCVDGTMQPFCEDTSLPPLYRNQGTPSVVTHFHDKGQTTTHDLLAPLLYPNAGSAEMRAESDKNAYVRMTLLYTHEPAAIDIFRLLSGLQVSSTRFMRFVNAIGTIAPDQRNPFMDDLLLWMKTHRTNAFIQEKGFSIIKGFVFEFDKYLGLYNDRGPIFWCRVADAIALHFDTPSFEESLFSLIEIYEFRDKQHEVDRIFMRSNSGGLATAVAIAVVCCDMMQRFLDKDLTLKRFQRIMNILSIVCQWRNKDFGESPEFARVSVYIARVLSDTECDITCQYFSNSMVKNLVAVNAARAFECGVLQAAVRAMMRCVEKPDFDMEDRQEEIVDVVHAVAVWADTAVHSDPLELCFLSECAMLFISKLVTTHVFDDSALAKLLQTTPDDIFKILTIVPAQNKQECHKILRKYNTVNLVMQIITHAFIKRKSNLLCIKWMYCLYAIIEDYPAGQEEAIKNSIVLIIEKVFENRVYVHTKYRLPATALFFLLMTQSFDKIPPSTDKFECVHRGSWAISRHHEVSNVLVHRCVKFCDEMRKRQYLAPTHNCAPEILHIISSLLSKNGSACTILQQDIITLLAQMATDDPDHKIVPHRNHQTLTLKIIIPVGEARSANHDANMSLLRKHFRITPCR